jgi:hypothetical protein
VTFLLQLLRSEDQRLTSAWSHDFSFATIQLLRPAYDHMTLLSHNPSAKLFLLFPVDKASVFVSLLLPWLRHPFFLGWNSLMIMVYDAQPEIAGNSFGLISIAPIMGVL